MKSIFTLLLILVFIHINSQTRTFEFSFCGRQQKVKLSKSETKYSGVIETEFHKKKSNRKIIRRKKIDKEIVKEIINQINKIGIYSFKDNDDKINCGDDYLDGDYFTIKISEGDFKFEKTYDEIYPESETKMIEKNDCRRNAQILATVIDNELKLKNVFNRHLKKNGYNICYWTGISEVCKVRKKK